MHDSIATWNLTRARTSRSSFNLPEQYVFYLFQMSFHEFLSLLRILALYRLKNLSVVAQHGKPTMRNTLDAPFEHELFTGIVQNPAHGFIAGDSRNRKMKIFIDQIEM